MRAWSLYTTSRSSYSGHEGYEDCVESHYSYDSCVPNHLQVAVWDLVVLRDETGSLGISFVEGIETTSGVKERHKCPVCGTSQIEMRRTLTPPFRCTRGHEFHSPDDVMDAVMLYCAAYARAFTRFRGLAAGELEQLCVARSRQNAIRELDLHQTLTSLSHHGIWPALVRND